MVKGEVIVEFIYNDVMRFRFWICLDWMVFLMNVEFCIGRDNLILIWFCCC